MRKLRKMIDISTEMRYTNRTCSRGVSGTLYLQSAIVGVMLHGGLSFAKLPLVSGVDVWVSRGETL